MDVDFKFQAFLFPDVVGNAVIHFLQPAVGFFQLFILPGQLAVDLHLFRHVLGHELIPTRLPVHGQVRAGEAVDAAIGKPQAALKLRPYGLRRVLNGGGQLSRTWG